jgi:WD40 repeat protein
LRLAVATGLSLSVVSFFTAALGVAFWAVDPHRMPAYVSVLQSLTVGSSTSAPSAVTLFWTMEQTGTEGRQLHLAVHPLDTTAAARILGGSDLRPYAIAAAPDQDHILVGTWNGEIQLLNLHAADAAPVCIGRQPDGAVAALSLADDGQTILSQGPHALHAWNLASRTKRWTRDDLGAYCHALLPGSEFGIVCTLDYRVLEIDLATGRVSRTLARYHSPILGSALDPKGRKLALLRADSTLLVLDTRTAAPCWERKIHRADRTAPGRMAAFSPCGTLLVTSGNSEANCLAIWNVATGQLVRELRGHRSVVQGASFDSCDALRSWAADGTIRLWNIPSGATEQINQLPVPNA